MWVRGLGKRWFPAGLGRVPPAGLGKGMPNWSGKVRLAMVL